MRARSLGAQVHVGAGGAFDAPVLASITAKLTWLTLGRRVALGTPRYQPHPKLGDCALETIPSSRKNTEPRPIPG
jgi:hypothetical protein